MSFKHNRLNQVIAETGETKEELCAKMGKHATLLNPYLSGRTSPKPETLFQFLLAAGWTVDKISNTTFGEWFTIADNGN